MGYKKVVIERHEDAGVFAILVIADFKGWLKYYKFIDSMGGMVEMDSDELENHEAYKDDIIPDLVKKADEVCKENSARLWSY